MIVELIGCAGAGKTTLARIVCEQGSASSRVRMLPDLVRDRPVLRRVTHPTAVNVVQEIGSFPYFVAGWREEREFVAYARRILARHARSRFDRLNGMRGIVRKLGMYRLAARRARSSVALSDEGTLLSAYNLFVMTDVDAGRLEVETFLRLVPVPDRVVLVSAPIPMLVARAHLRSSPRRQHRRRSAAEVEWDIRRTVELFELMAASPVIADRLLVIENEDGDDAALRQRAHEIASWLRKPADGRHRLAPAETSLPGSRA